MTPQEQRNKRFDEKFAEKIKYIDYCLPEGVGMLNIDDLKSHLTSEVNLAIEEVEKWAESKEIPIPRFATELENDIWKNGYETILVDLLSFLTTLKK
jgi:hypothetical protein